MPEDRQNPAQSPTVEDEAEKAKAKKAAEKEQEIYKNFATPLAGTFLNLPKEPVLIKCPGCGFLELTKVENDLKWWAIEFNRIFGCCFVTLCCCCCLNYSIPCKQADRNHYCKNCGCYLGRTLKHSRIQPKSKK